jgi:hypothetical protein
MSIKPHFALMIVATLPYLLWRLGLRKFLTTLEFYAATFFVLAYVALIVLLFPVYLHRIAPIVASVYVPIRVPFVALTLISRGPVCWLVLGAIVLVFGSRRLVEPMIAIPALASVGAIAAFFIQGKGWPYHAYPALALMALALTPLVAQAAAAFRIDGIPILASSAAALTLAFAFLSHTKNGTSPALERLVASLALHPKILVIGPDISAGHPLTRDVSGEWVGTPCSLWITASIQYLEKAGVSDEAAQRYEPYQRFDRETLISDIRTRTPDAILIDGDNWKNWTFSHADVAAALADYAPVGAVGEVMVYGRKAGPRTLNTGSGPP